MSERAATGQKRRRYGTIEAPIVEELEVPKRRQRLGSCATHSVSVAAWSTEKVVDSLREHGITEDSVLQSFHG